MGNKNQKEGKAPEKEIVIPGLTPMKMEDHESYNEEVFIKFDKLDVISVYRTNPVYFYKANYEKKEVSLVMTKLKLFRHDKTLDFLFQEIKNLKNLKHPNLAEYFGLTKNVARVGFLFEPEIGTVQELLTETEEENDLVSNMKNNLQLLTKVATVLSYLHENEVIHGSLDWDAVTMNKEYEPKFFGFGLKNKLNALRHIKPGDSVCNHLASEVTLNEEDGIKLLTENFDPYGRYPEFNVELKVSLNPDFRPKIDEEFLGKEEKMEYLVELMKKCWSSKVEERPSFKEILEVLEKNNIEENESYFEDYEKRFEDWKVLKKEREEKENNEESNSSEDDEKDENDDD